MWSYVCQCFSCDKFLIYVLLTVLLVSLLQCGQQQSQLKGEINQLRHEFEIFRGGSNSFEQYYTKSSSTVSHDSSNQQKRYKRSLKDDKNDYSNDVRIKTTI